MLTKFQKGDTVRHYKNGLLYRVEGEFFDSARDYPVVLYKPLYPCDKEGFVQSVARFEEVINGTPRFSKVEPDAAEQGYAVYLHPVVRVKVPVMAASAEDAMKKARGRLWGSEGQDLYDLLRAPKHRCQAADVEYTEFAEAFAYVMVESLPPADSPFEDPEQTWYFDQDGTDVTAIATETQAIPAKF